MCEAVATIEYKGLPMEIYESDLKLIQYLREIGFGRIMDIKVQNGRAIMLDEAKKIGGYKVVRQVKI